MQSTDLLYMKNMSQLECNATVLDIFLIDNLTTIILDQTVFYPQGGGQPFDIGFIKKDDVIFKVLEVRFVNGQVHHKGVYESGVFNKQDIVNCQVQVDRRSLNTRLHSAGHVIDMALKELSIDWQPSKGYHFPQGAYVEYFVPESYIIDDSLKIELENKVNEIIHRNINTSVKFLENESANDKVCRIVYYGDYSVPCGGTHCDNLSQINKIQIRKIKKDKDLIKISYELV